MSNPAEALNLQMEPAPPKGRLKIFLGYAAGVGKTYQMLAEAQELRRKGADVVIGYFEPHGRQDTIARTAGLEFVPRKRIEYRGSAFEELDTEAVLRRKPAVCLVDEFAHTNVPGSERLKRWEDVQVLLQAGIDVFTTLNVQHLESLNDEVWRITGVRVRETVPDWVVDAADEVVLVDLTPEALQNRLERGAVYTADKAKKAMENFFTETNLTALREMALRHTAHEIEGRFSEFSARAPGKTQAVRPDAELPVRHERILICLTGRPSTAMLIRRGKRVADYLHADCLAVHVQRNSSTDRARSEALEKHLSFARNLHIETHVLRGNVAKSIVDFARHENITQIFLGRTRGKSLWRSASTVHRVVRLARDREITIVAERRR